MAISRSPDRGVSMQKEYRSDKLHVVPPQPPTEWDSDAYNRLSDPQWNWGTAVLKRIAVTGNEVLMDAGCGTGRVTAELVQLLPLGRVIAVDLSKNMLQQAAANLARFGDRVALVQADLAALPFCGAV